MSELETYCIPVDTSMQISVCSYAHEFPPFWTLIVLMAIMFLITKESIRKLNAECYRAKAFHVTMYTPISLTSGPRIFALLDSVLLHLIMI